MSDVTRLTAAATAQAIADKQVSAVEVAQAHLDRIAAVDGRVHAYLHVDAEGALKQAARVDAGELTGPLAGVPLALKDVIVQKGIPTTVGSRILEGWRPPYVGFTPTVPVTAAGCRIEPPVSVPMASGAR